MTQKYDINNTYVSEMSKLQLLIALGTGRSSLSGSWVSTSSSISYTYTNETDLMTQLSIVLEPYMITANDWNSLNTLTTSDIPGRYQADYGFNGATLSNITIDTNDVASISTGQTSGTITKIITPSDLDKWGSLKVTTTLAATPTATVTIKDLSDNILISATSLTESSNVVDLSSVSITSYTSLKVVYSLTRSDAGDTSPTLYNHSVTWEGRGNGIVKIVDTTLSVAVSAVNITIPSGYSFLKLQFFARNDTALSYLNIRFNSDTGNKYSYHFSTNSLGSNTWVGSGISGATPDTAIVSPVNTLIPTSYNCLTYGEVEFRNDGTYYKNGLIRYSNNVGTNSNAWMSLGSFVFNATTEITSINLSPSANKIDAGARFVLWGVK